MLDLPYSFLLGDILLMFDGHKAKGNIEDNIFRRTLIQRSII